MLSAAVAVAGCENQEANHEPTVTDTSAALAPRADTSTTGVALDPRYGSLQAEATGAVAGSWTFADVNGSISESARGGATNTTLQLEAHRDPPGVHLRLRLTSDEDVEQGEYRIGGEGGRTLDAAFEHDGRFFRSIGDASGAVELTRLTGDRAVGSFEFTLSSLSDDPGTVRVKGDFDMVVQK
jgi:hypothetical protein